jgi:SAM-dependent methyltransferase
MKDTIFYNTESKEIGHITRDKKNLSLLEVGCADGVVIRTIWEKFPHVFSSLKAIDIAPEMISAAKNLNTGTPIDFEVRTEEVLKDTSDIIVEIGVLNFADFKEEFGVMAASLTPDGTYLCSLSSSTSLYNRLKGASGYRHLNSYAEYERELREYFVIESVDGVGFFVPWLWKMPALARALQPVIEKVALTFVPSLAHEKIYVLTPRAK